ncbi:MAG: hypothetical protein GY895_10580 [Phycisphaera sp.]|nr:hypothetical protein [Phycisphaera sp.]
MLAIGAVVMGGGSMRDCRDAYCDAVRAGATAVQAWHFHCCSESDSRGAPASVDCEDLPNRIARFSLLAAEAREVCEAQNWGRLRDIWREFRGLVPLRFVSTVWREACGESVAWGENRWTPLGPDVVFSIALPFEPAEPPRVVFGGAEAPHATIDEAGGTTAWIERARTLRSGTSVAMQFGGRAVKATLDGRLVVAARVGSTGSAASCGLSRPVEFRLDLRGEGWSGTIDLVEGFEGNRIIETNDGVEMLGMLVRIDLELDGPMGISTAGVFDEAFLQVPVERGPEGSLRIGANHVIDGLELLPVDPSLASMYRSDPVRGLQPSGVDCGAFARARAEAFLDLHPGCRPAPVIGGPVED